MPVSRSEQRHLFMDWFLLAEFAIWQNGNDRYSIFFDMMSFITASTN